MCPKSLTQTNSLLDSMNALFDNKNVMNGVKNYLEILFTSISGITWWA